MCGAAKTNKNKKKKSKLSLRLLLMKKKVEIIERNFVFQWETMYPQVTGFCVYRKEFSLQEWSVTMTRFIPEKLVKIKGDNAAGVEEAHK